MLFICENEENKKQILLMLLLKNK